MIIYNELKRKGKGLMREEFFFFIPAAVFLFGLLTGSFLNVCICRIPEKTSFVAGRSRCPDCGSLIPWYCNIPLLSYAILKGRCKDCKAKISPLYPVVELLNALLFLLVFYVYDISVLSLLNAAVFSVLIVISFIDLRHQIIPDGLVIAILILAVAKIIYASFLLGVIPWHTWIIGFFAASVPLLILGLIFKNGIGGGDIKLMAAAGFFLGWRLILLSLFMASLYGAIVSIPLMISGRATMKSALPFGPFLSSGIITSALAGEKIVFWYFSLFF